MDSASDSRETCRRMSSADSPSRTFNEARALCAGNSATGNSERCPARIFMRVLRFSPSMRPALYARETDALARHPPRGLAPSMRPALYARETSFNEARALSSASASHDVIPSMRPALYARETRRATPFSPSMRPALYARETDALARISFNEARALCAGNGDSPCPSMRPALYARETLMAASGSRRGTPAFNEARALCAGN